MRGAVAFALCAAVVAAQDDASSRLRDGDPAVRAAAAEEIGKRGPAAALAVPQLIELVYDDFDAPSKAAMVALGRIGPAASEARPYLVDRTLGRGDFEPIVAQALARIGPPDADAPLVAWLRAKGAVPAGPCTLEDLANRNLKAQLLEALGNEHALVVAQAARLLGPAARTNEEVVAALVPLLDHPSACVRLNAGVAVSYSPLAEATFAKMLEDKDPKRRRVAARFLRGPGAVPLLRRALRDPDAAVRCWAVGGFSTQDVRGNPGLVAELATLLDRDPLLCSLFSTLLGTLGAEAAPAVPAFARCLASADPDLRWSACYVLGRIGEHAGPAAVPLAFAAFDEREQVAIAAVQALTAIGAAARDAAPYLAELAEADLSLGPHARRTLAVIGAGVPLPPLPDPAELPALKAELAGDDGKSAGRAAFAIGRLAANDPETLEALGAALSHPSPYARKHAALALQRIGPSSLPLIARAGAGPDPGRRLAAGTLIHFAGVAPDNLVPVAVGLLASDDAFVKREAIRSLGVAGTRGRDAVPTLVACLRDENAEIVQVSIWALGRMRADATGAVPFLIEILDTSGHRDHALMAVQALGEIGQTAAPAIPSIVAAARRPKIGAQLFNPSVDALASMGPAGQAAVVQLIREEKGHEREYAITVLVQRSLSPPGLKEALEEVLKNCDAQTREVALTAIRQLGPESKPSLESLLAALKSGPLDTRARAQIVWGIAEAAPVADLLKMARDKDAKLRQVGFEALSMKPQTAFTDADRLQVLPLILDALEHGDAALQASAAATLPNAPPKSFDERLLRLVGNRGPAQSHLSRAIVAMGPEVVPKLTMALSGDSRDLRNGAAIALAQFGPAARMAIPALVEAVLDDPAASTEFVRAIIATKDLERFAALFADPRMPNRERFGDALVAAGVDALPHFDTLRRHPAG